MQMSVTEDALLAFLRQLPQLEELSVWDKYGPTRMIGSGILRALVVTHEGHAALLPHLVRLRVEDAHHFTASELADVVESRGRNREHLGLVSSGKRLRHVEVAFCMPQGAMIDKEGRARLQACQRSGLDISCTWCEIYGEESMEVATL